MQYSSWYVCIYILFTNFTAYTLNVNIPVNRNAQVYVSKLALSNVVITESGTAVWKNDRFIATNGITDAVDHGEEIVFSVGSGTYAFSVTGSGNTMTCDSAVETDTITLACPAGQTISA